MYRKLTCLTAAALLAVWLAAGCKSKEEETKEPESGGGTVTGRGGRDRPVEPGPLPPGVDARDSTAPEVQGKFPKTRQVGRWVKVTQVNFYPATELEGIVPQPSLFQPYGVDWAADAQYQLGNDADQRLVVQLFHCRESSDAYGLMSIASDQPAEVQLGQEARGGVGIQLHIWTGPYYLNMRSQQQGLTFIRAMRDLARDMVSNLPKGGEAPALLKALPERHVVLGRVHYFRGSASLASRGLTLVHDQPLARTMALGSDDQLVVAAYRAPAARGPCFMFVAEYGTLEKARAAYDRLSLLQSEGKTAFGQSVLFEMKGRHVYGTLTGDEYGQLEDTAKKDELADELPVFPTIAKRLAELR